MWVYDYQGNKDLPVMEYWVVLKKLDDQPLFFPIYIQICIIILQAWAVDHINILPAIKPSAQNAKNQNTMSQRKWSLLIHLLCWWWSSISKSNKKKVYTQLNSKASFTEGRLKFDQQVIYEPIPCWAVRTDDKAVSAQFLQNGHRQGPLYYTTLGDW